MTPDRLSILHISPQPKEVAQHYARHDFDVRKTLSSSFHDACMELGIDELNMPTIYSEDGVPTYDEVRRDFQGVVVSGSVHSVYDAPEWDHKVELLLREMADQQQIAFLGICYGQQLAAQACGGSVEEGLKGPEVGVVPIELTRYGRTDPLFDGLGDSFYGHAVHKDTVMIPPRANGSWVRELARSEKYDHQAFAIGDAGRTVQFHPEISPEALKILLTLEPSDHVAPNPGLTEVWKAGHTGQRILRNFVTHFVHKNGFQ